MQSPYGKKLFRLLFLFALIPSAFLAASGYYLARDASQAIYQPNPEVVTDPVRVFQEELEINIRAEVARLANRGGTEQSWLDLAIGPTGDLIDSAIGVDVSETDITAILRAAQTRSSGLVESESGLWQFATQKLDDSTTVIGAVRHDPRLTEAIAAYRVGQVAGATSDRLRPSYLLFLGLLFVFLTVIAGLLAYLFSSRVSRNLSRPVMEMAAAASTIARGDFSQRIHSRSTGEIQVLIDNFNSMASQLEATTSRLTQAERVAAWRHVARRFAHELKNPLQPILISLYRMEKDLGASATDDRVRRSLTAVAEDVKSLGTLAERFSELSKLPPPKMEMIDPGALIRSVAQLYGDQLSDYDFRVDVPESPDGVMLDETYLREALHNLLKNALEATPSGGIIELNLRQSRGETSITVRDNGTGMTEEVLKAARMPYYTTKQSGSGLGLAVVERTVAELGGHLDIKSDPATGTTVTIHLMHRVGGTNA